MIPFYGIPEITVTTGEYVQLPTMREVFENLVPMVYVQYRRGEPSLKFECLNSNIHRLPPLMLVDRLPVFDQKAFLSVDPSKIKQIDVVNEVYVKGNTMFGGIISLTTYEGDMAAIDLPEGSYFFDYQAFHPENHPGTGYEIIRLEARDSGADSIPIIFNQTNQRIPDTRNTLLWIDRLKLDTNDTTIMQFRAASATGDYQILIRGISANGRVVQGVCAFTVE